MDYLSIDLTSFPIRTMRSALVAKKLLIKEYALGPSDKREEFAWLSGWIKGEKRWFKPTAVLAVWDDPDLNVRIQMRKEPKPLQEEAVVEADDEGAVDPEPHKAVEEKKTAIGIACPLEHRDPSHTGHHQPFELRAELPRDKNESLVEMMQELHAACQQITVIPLTMWSAFLMSYPDHRNQTVAIVWRSRDALTVIVVDYGRLVFYRHFETAEFQADAWVIRIKECLENFSFLFPSQKIDLVLFGGDPKNQEEAREWIQEGVGAPCELVLPLHSGQIDFLKQSNGDRQEKQLSSYWACMGMVWSQGIAW